MTKQYKVSWKCPHCNEVQSVQGPAETEAEALVCAAKHLSKDEPEMLLLAWMLPQAELKVEQVVEIEGFTNLGENRVQLN